MSRFFSIVLFAVLFIAHSRTAAAQGIPWGPYYVASERLPDTEEGAQQWHIGILTQNGQVVRDIQGYHHAEALQVDVGRNKPSVLLVSVGDGGNDGLDVVYAYVIGYQRRVRNLFAVPGMADDFTFAKLDGGYVPGLVFSDHSALKEFDHFSRGALGPIHRVYRWEFDKYIDTTRYYPDQSLHEARLAQAMFLHTLKSEEAYVRSDLVDGHEDSMTSSHEDVMAPAIEYWANELAAGRGDDADHFFHAHCSKSLRVWLERRRALVARAVKNPLPTNNSIRVLM